jgi:hypothetical protein
MKYGERLSPTLPEKISNLCYLCRTPSQALQVISFSDEDIRHALRSADILTCIIFDISFAGAVRTLKIYAPAHDKDGTMAFQTGTWLNHVSV